MHAIRKRILTYFLCLYQHSKSKMQIIIDVLICFKQNHIVLNINPLHITCIFIKPSQALFAWKMFLSTYYFTRGLWSAIAYRNTGMISVILIWEMRNNLELNSKLFIITSNYLDCSTKSIYVNNEAEFVKGQLSSHFNTCWNIKLPWNTDLS